MTTEKKLLPKELLPKKLLLVELGPSHSEVFYSQLLFCKQSGYEVSLLCNTNFQDKTILAAFDHVYHFALSDSIWTRYITQVRQIRKIIIKNNFDYVVFNTAMGNF